MPGAPEQASQGWIAVALMLGVVLILSFGGTIERMLEYFAWTMLGVVFVFLLVINIIYVFIGTFGIIDTTTQGGPGQDTSILVYKVYFDGFKAMDLGASATQSVVLMAILICLTVIQFRYVERRVHY